MLVLAHFRIDVASMSIYRNIAISLLRWIASDEIEYAIHRQRNANRCPLRWKML
jgi:hypothetical protein